MGLRARRLCVHLSDDGYGGPSYGMSPALFPTKPSLQSQRQTVSGAIMSESFDPYHKWLGIPPTHRPPSHYRLLGIEDFEKDNDVISDAADQRMTHVKAFQSGRYSSLSQNILNELATARRCLLDSSQKAKYDAELRNQQNRRKPPPRPGDVPAQVVPLPMADLAEDAVDGSSPPVDGDATKSAQHGDVKITRKKRYRPQQRAKINLLGHVIAPIAGLVLGAILLRTCTSGDPTPSALEGGTAVVENIKENGNSPSAVKPKEPEEIGPSSNPPVTKPPDGNQPVVDPPERNEPQPMGPTPDQRLDSAYATGNVKEVFDLLAKHAELRGADLIAGKLLALEQLQKYVDPNDSQNATLAAQEAIALIGANNLSRPQEFLMRCMNVVGAFTPHSKDDFVKQTAQDRLTLLKDQFVTRRELGRALEVSLAISTLQNGNGDRQTVILDLLKQVKDQADEPQQLKALAEFSAAFLKDAANCDQKEFLKECKSIAIIAARKHYRESGENDVLNRVTLVIVDFHSRCE